MFFLASVSAAWTHTATAGEFKRITVTFRFDDYSSCSSTDFEVGLLRIFGKQGIPVTVAVIPYHCTGSTHNPARQKLSPFTAEKAEILVAAIRAGTVEPAVHGYSHQTTRSDMIAEFVGLPLAAQVERISKGKTLLERMLHTTIGTFVPPWNRYDANTVEALEGLGFRTLSCGCRRPPGGTSKLCFVPVTCRLCEVAHAIESARASTELAPLVIAVLHECDFREVNATGDAMDLGDLADLLRWVKSQPDVKTSTIGQMAETNPGLTLARCRDYWRITSGSHPWLPPSVTNDLPYYPSSATLARLKLAHRLEPVVWYGGVFAASFGVAIPFGLVTFWVLPRIACWATCVVWASTVAFTLYAFRDFAICCPGAVAISFLFGTSIALCLCYRTIRKNVEGGEYTIPLVQRAENTASSYQATSMRHEEGIA